MRELVVSFLKKFPRIQGTARIWFGERNKGRYYKDEFSSDLEFISTSYEQFYNSYAKGRNPAYIKFLSIGAGGVQRKKQKQFIGDANYILLDIEKKAINGDDITVIEADICNCREIDSNSVDFVFSNSIFEHLHSPWKACEEIGRILKPGGICYTDTVFSWRYHPVREDYYRYTHTGLRFLFETYGKLKTIACGYNINGRRGNILGGKHPENKDAVKTDCYGGWLENWIVIHVGEKPQKT